MASSLNMIGSFFFVALRGYPDVPKPQLEVETRPAVNGAQVTFLGYHPQRFTLRSQVDAPTFFAARQLFIAYQSLIGAAPVLCIWSGYDLSAEGLLHLVLDVRCVQCKTIPLAIGGINPPSQGYLECDWDLLPLTV